MKLIYSIVLPIRHISTDFIKCTVFKNDATSIYHLRPNQNRALTRLQICRTIILVQMNERKVNSILRESTRALYTVNVYAKISLGY